MSSSMIHYPVSDNLFTYVNYILRVNSDYSKCHTMQINLHEYMKTYLKIEFIFYNEENSKIAGIEYHAHLNNTNTNYWYTLKYRSIEIDYWHTQNVKKKSVIEELDFINKKLFKKNHKKNTIESLKFLNYNF